MDIKPASKIKWNEIAKAGNPPNELRKSDAGLDRQFLVRGEYSIQVAYLFSDGSGFETPEDWTDTPIAWAVVEGF